jgi:rare lipoprotein A
MIMLSGGMTVPEGDGEFWYAGYLDYAIQNALLTSGPDGDYDPEATLTRGEFVDLLYRLENNEYTGEDEYGVASYYSYSFDGANTASGVALDAYSGMAAHKTLPFGTWVRVTNLNNNESVDVEIVDRGPFVEGRIIDLTPAAFEEIAWLSSGIVNVRIEVLEDQE